MQPYVATRIRLMLSHKGPQLAMIWCTAYTPEASDWTNPSHDVVLSTARLRTPAVEHTCKTATLSIWHQIATLLPLSKAATPSLQFCMLAISPLLIVTTLKLQEHFALSRCTTIIEPISTSRRGTVCQCDVAAHWQFTPPATTAIGRT